jgi:threonine dehydrogenase-like Zn-dependent dehydrogenase
MKAVSCFEGNLSVVELPTPQPAAGQLLLEVRRCGICGSDLHAKDHADELAEVTAATGYADFMRASTPVVMGHEFLRRGRRARPRGCQGVQAQHLRFVLGYTPLEFHDTLHMLADGKLDASALVTGTVGLDGVDAAFRALGDPERHAKILIDPSSPAKTV